MSLGYGGPKPGSPRAAIEAQAQRIRVYRNTPQALTSGAGNPIEWDVEDYKSGITHSNVVNPDELTIVTAGRYVVLCQAQVRLTDAGAATDVFTMALLINGSSKLQANESLLLSGGIVFATGVSRVIRLNDVLTLAVGDVLTFVIRQDQAAGSPNLQGNLGAAGNSNSWATLHRVS